MMPVQNQIDVILWQHINSVNKGIIKSQKDPIYIFVAYIIPSLFTFPSSDSLPVTHKLNPGVNYVSHL